MKNCSKCKGPSIDEFIAARNHELKTGKRVSIVKALDRAIKKSRKSQPSTIACAAP